MNFALVGAAGYIAKRHMEAIKNVGGTLVAAVDPHDSVGILDSYFPKCSFFTEFERFDRFCEKLRGSKDSIDYVSICSPNYLHDAHCRFTLRIGADAICEKPLVLKEKNLDALKNLERERNRKIYTILQLRLHPNALKLRKLVKNIQDFSTIKVNYVTPRGYWYDYSWKSNVEKSGGLATNIGIHLFDLLIWLFGPVKSGTVTEVSSKNVKGELRFLKGSASFHLSTGGNTPIRSFSVNGKEFDFSGSFTELHTKSYENILDGNGFGIEDIRFAVRVAEQIRALSL